MSAPVIIFIACAVACLTPFVSPPIALALGLFVALKVGNPFARSTARWTRFLLQTSVVLLGFGMSLANVVKAGKEGVIFSVATIFGTLVFGLLIGKLLGIREKTSALITSGTAICGGSAIAAVAPAIDAESEDISVALCTVFILNSAALVLFPVVGHFFGLSQQQFGLWAAVAIHDTSSVVGAGAKYGAEALQIATTVKLARAIWIAPIAFGFALFYKSKSRIAIPWFIVLFLVATTLRTYAPSAVPPSVFDALVNVAKTGLTLTLFLIGAGLSRETLRKVGLKPFLQGLILWIAISIATLIAVKLY